MSPRSALLTLHFERFPRVSGDEPDSVFLNLSVASFSPRERG